MRAGEQEYDRPNRGLTGFSSVAKIQLVEEFLQKFVTTHEFHHKGQILSMGRQLGHVPPDTDVIAVD